MPEAIVILWTHVMYDILVSIAWSIALKPYQCQVITSANPNFWWMEPSLTRWHQSELDEIDQTAFKMHLCDWKLVSIN